MSCKIKKMVGHAFIAFTHLPRTKWLPFRRRHIQMHFHESNICILIRISLKFALKGSIENKPVLVQVMAGQRTGLPEPMRVPWRIYAARGIWVQYHCHERNFISHIYLGQGQQNTYIFTSSTTRQITAFEQFHRRHGLQSQSFIIKLYISD